MERHGKLLLVEDEDSLRGLVAQFLRASHYEVVEARDGREAVERFHAEQPFALALVDLNLPYLSGVEVCRRIRESTPDQKILICSAAITVEFEGALLSLGVDHFLTKPYHPEMLLAYIRRALEGTPPAHSGRWAVAGRS